MIDLLIRNGLLVDGTNTKGYISDIAISNGVIIDIGNNFEYKAKIEIDAKGLVVTPGFIDVHSHNDLVPFSEEKMHLKLLQGVTTELVGQCGLGVIPCVNPLWKNYIRGVVGDMGDLNFNDVDDYFTLLKDKGLKNNYATLIAHGAIRSYVMGFDDRIPSEHELTKMANILESALNHGVFGMSLGLQYLPGIFSTRNELVKLCEIVNQYKGIVMVHLRNHDKSIVKALTEIIEIGRISRVKLHISHLRSYTSNTIGCNAKEILNIIDSAVSENINITFDEHLYLSGSTLLSQLLPPWVSRKGIECLKDDLVLKRLKEELSNHEILYLGWDNYSLIKGFEAIMITSVNREENRKYIGRTIADISTELGVHPVDFVAKLIIEEKTGVGIVTLDIFSLDDTIQLIKHDLQMVGSDSIPAGVPHPRLYGNYPLFIGKFVRDLKVLTLEEAIYKCTQLPAKTIGIENRGILEIGKIADITILNLNEITGYEDYHNSRKPPVGIKYVIVNGKVAVNETKPCTGYFGEVIKLKN